MKVWITRYALTSGVFTIDAEVHESSSGKPFCSYKRSGCFGEFAHGEDWHITELSANERFDKMISNKLMSLRKQTTKLLDLAFTVRDL